MLEALEKAADARLRLREDFAKQAAELAVLRRELLLGQLQLQQSNQALADALLRNEHLERQLREATARLNAERDAKREPYDGI